MRRTDPKNSPSIQSAPLNEGRTLSSPWQCAVPEKPDRIQVGQKLEIFCEGKDRRDFAGDLQIVFSNAKDLHKLYIVKTLHKTPFSVRFSAVPWRAGDFQNIPFTLSDGKVFAEAEGLSFSVESVLTEKSSVHPPFGPWKEPWPKALLFSSAAAALLLLLASGIFLRALFKRRRFIQTVLQRRKDASACKQFIRALREKNAPLAAADLEKLFQTFIEDCLFIPAIQQRPEAILKNFKLYHKKLAGQFGKKAAALLHEIQICKEDEDPNIAKELEKNARELAVELSARTAAEKHADLS